MYKCQGVLLYFLSKQICQISLGKCSIPSKKSLVNITYSNVYFQIRKVRNNFCIPMTFNNPLKVCFFSKKNTITTQTCPTQIVKVYLLLKNRGLMVF